MLGPDWHPVRHEACPTEQRKISPESLGWPTEALLNHNWEAPLCYPRPTSFAPVPVSPDVAVPGKADLGWTGSMCMCARTCVFMGTNN